MKRTLFLVVVALFASHAYGQQLLDQVQYDVPYEQQNTLEWCWVASAQMVVEALGVDTPSQCDMLQQVYRAPCCMRPNVCNRPGYIQEVQNLISTFGFRPTVLQNWGDGFSFFRTLRDSGAPLVVYVDRSHFVVVTGMRIVQSSIGPFGIVNINDPFRGIGEQDWPIFSRRIGAVVVTLKGQE